MPKLLFISNLYPSSVEPDRATYNRALINAIQQQGFDIHVIAPLFRPLPLSWVGSSQLPPEREMLDGLTVLHPVFRYIPRFLVHIHHRLYRRAVSQCFQTQLREFQPDHVMIGFVFPDAAAIAPLCRRQGVSYSVRVNGSDFRLRTAQPRFKATVIQVLKEAPRIFCRVTN